MATGIPISRTDRLSEIRRDLDRDDRLYIDYEGKRNPGDIIANCPRAKVTIAQPPRHSNDWVDRLYFGDNLGILGTLLDEPAVRGQVSLVYIDPPYSTKSVFESREQKVAYHDVISGAAFVESLRERLIVLRELLSVRGSIYVHLDENMAFPMKIIMDEVFGAGNFRNFITRKKCNTKNYTRRTYGNISDYILFYTKTQDYVWNRPVIAWSDETAKKEYSYVEASTGRRFKKVPVHAPGVRNGATGKPWRGMLPPPGKHWQFPPSSLEEMDRRGEIFWSSNGNPRRKIYLEDSDGIPVQDIWLDFKDAHNQNIEITGYPTEKNVEMLEQIISASSDTGDLVLDCFAGSGTTLVASGNLGRRWIGIDNSNEAINAILERLRFGSRPMGDYVKKKTALPVNDHLELLFSETDVGKEVTTTGIAKDFCLYQSGNTLEFRSHTDGGCVVKENAAKQDHSDQSRKAIYSSLRKAPPKKLKT